MRKERKGKTAPYCTKSKFDHSNASSFLPTSTSTNFSSSSFSTQCLQFSTKVQLVFNNWHGQHTGMQTPIQHPFQLQNYSNGGQMP